MSTTNGGSSNYQITSYFGKWTSDCHCDIKLPQPQHSHGWVHCQVGQTGFHWKVYFKITVTREVEFLKQRVASVEDSQQFINAAYEQQAVSSYSITEIKQELNAMKISLDASISENKRLNEDILDVKCRNMRANLFIYGIPE